MTVGVHDTKARSESCSYLDIAVPQRPQQLELKEHPQLQELHLHLQELHCNYKSSIYIYNYDVDGHSDK
ncbi:hypothetical protein KIN20_023543 [Parelaphostrongylus tenuis]|uniref:Uncharacterized protein n=1 Tax=Parelaphostrongylus tenuis TaxID=148309 RepID=A0AAD5MRU7_PARTN|nr:hypothetical protein KIN20_023543 [Parelaphostrongylus tenuis]